MSDDDLRAELAAVRAEAADLRDIIEEAHRTCDRLGVPVRPVRPLTSRIEAVAEASIARARAAIEAIPRRSGTPEWSKAAAVGQAAGYDVGLAVAAGAVSAARQPTVPPTWNPMAQSFAP